MALMRRSLFPVLLVAGTFMFSRWSAMAATEVDLSLVLAVDVSLSMESDEQELQRKGFVAAFRSLDAHEAISNGALGRIAFMYVEWAGASHQKIIVPWTVIEQFSDGLNFSARFADTAKIALERR